MLQYLFGRLRDRKLDPLVRNLFRLSYGGNRNYTLMHTLGHIMISADDDMRPYALVEDSPETLGLGEISRGKLFKSSDGGFTRKSFDILSAFMDVLGKSVRDTPANDDRGEQLLNSAMDLETNASQGLSRENSLLLRPGEVSDSAVFKMAQTSGPAPTISMPSTSWKCSSTTSQRSASMSSTRFTYSSTSAP